MAGINIIWEKMKRKLIYITLLGIALIIFSAISGLLIGMYLGGNYFVNFEFAKVRGYEAVGILGMIFGVGIGFITTILVVVRYRKK